MMLEKSSTPAVDGGAAAHQLKVRSIILHHLTRLLLIQVLKYLVLYLPTTKYLSTVHRCLARRCPGLRRLFSLTLEWLSTDGSGRTGSLFESFSPVGQNPCSQAS